jgi:hypothetical protein
MEINFHFHLSRRLDLEQCFLLLTFDDNFLSFVSATVRANNESVRNALERANFQHPSQVTESLRELLMLATFLLGSMTLSHRNGNKFKLP